MNAKTKVMTLADEIYASEKTRKPAETTLTTDERVLARITDGIYRQPSSALRELISNAYDADATEVIINTDAPRFSDISIRDNGIGLSPKVLEHLVRHIGGSVKHSPIGQELDVTAKYDSDYSPGGRKFIGKLGIGLFSVSQFTRHFLIITKQKGEKFRTIADITLGAVSGMQKSKKKADKIEIETGSARIWREPASEEDSQGTEIKLLNLLPRTRKELASDDMWFKLEYESKDAEIKPSSPPAWHIGRMTPGQETLIEKQPELPWDEEASPRERFEKLICAVREAAKSGAESVDLDKIFDNYLRTLWVLSQSAPLEYAEGHPFDLENEDEFRFFELSNELSGQAEEVQLESGECPRKKFNLKSPANAMGKQPFNLFMDGIQLFRPILFKNLPKTSRAVKTPLLFIGHDNQKFKTKPEQLSGGTLTFEAYLFWAPRIIPKQHQGVTIRVGNASGALFDSTFMNYQVSEQTRLRQLTAEIFVSEGLEEAINIDRESYNYAHPHYQYLVKWLHSAIRQFANRHKDIGKTIRSSRLHKHGAGVREKISEIVSESLKRRGVEDLPSVVLVPSNKESQISEYRSQGKIALRKEKVLPSQTGTRASAPSIEQRRIEEKKAVAITQLLHGWGLLNELTYDDQESLLADIFEILFTETD